VGEHAAPSRVDAADGGQDADPAARAQANHDLARVKVRYSSLSVIRRIRPVLVEIVVIWVVTALPRLCRRDGS